MSSEQSEINQGRRSKERFVWEAIEFVQKWRDLFENGFYDEVGNFKKPTLKQAAAIVGIPKKTLEDYHSILRKAAEQIDVMRVLDKKMGYMRQFIKEVKIEPAPSSSKDQIQIEQEENENENENSWNNMIIQAEDDDQMIGECIQEDEYDKFFQQEEDYYVQQDYLFEEDEYQFERQEEFEQFDQFEANPALPDS